MGHFLVVVRVGPEGYYVVGTSDLEKTAKRWAVTQSERFTEAGVPAEVSVWDTEREAEVSK